jgi:thiosulfate/3-mercaptopyruvate sulfurtransferase
MMQNSIPSLLQATDAVKLSHEGRILFLDATFHLPNAGRDATAEFLTEHIAGAVRFDLDEMSDRSSPFPHTMPASDFFAHAMRRLGANTEDHIIVYDNSVFLSSARAWWMLRYFGHDRVSILDGGLQAWKAAGGACETGHQAKQEGDFTSGPSTLKLATRQDVQAAIQQNGITQIIDARGVGRFSGAEAEPRPGMASGHMPGAINLPISSLLENGFVKSVDDIRTKLDDAQIAPDKPIITTCGSGVTACGLAFAFHLLGIDNVAMYDGSWAEWGHGDQNRDACPVAISARV